MANGTVVQRETALCGRDGALAAVSRGVLVERDTAASGFLSPSTVTLLLRFAAARPRLLSARPLGEGGWSGWLLSIDGCAACSQPQLCRSSSRLCRPCSHGQALVLANKISAWIYAETPLYH